MFMPYEITAMKLNAKREYGYDFEVCSDMGRREFRPIGDPIIHKFIVGREDTGEMILFLMTMVTITESRLLNALSAIPGVRRVVLWLTAKKVHKRLL